MQLLEDPEKLKPKGEIEGAPGQGKQLRANLLATQPFEEVFGPNKKRKRPSLGAIECLPGLVEAAEKKDESYEEKVPDDGTFRDGVSLSL